jgi:outer membrane protein OmpA-like peptidoglycan-associated protein
MAQQSHGKIIKGKKLYESYSYSKAIEKLEAVENKTTDINRMLADSYFKLGKLEESAEYYNLFINTTEATAEDFYKYAFLMRMLKKYPESQEWMHKFKELRPDDTRAIAYTADENFYIKLAKDNGQFKIKNLDINSPQSDFGPAYYSKDSTDYIVFTSARETTNPIKRKWSWNEQAYLNMFMAERNSANELSNIVKFPSVNKRLHEGPASFTKDGSFMVFTRNNYANKDSLGIVRLELYFMEYVDGKWQNEKSFTYNNDNYSVGHGCLSPNGDTLFFASDMPGGMGGSDLYISVRIDDTTWSKPKNLGPNVNTEGNELFPFYHADGKMLFFASNGKVGLGGLDIFVAPFNNEAGKAINPGATINSNMDDFAFILNDKQKTGFFSSNRAEGKGDDDIYSFELLKPFLFGKTIKGTATDKQGTILANVRVLLFDADNNIIDSAVTSDDGSFSFVVEADKLYKLSGNKDEYFEGTNTADTKTDQDVIIADLMLEKDPGLSLFAVVTDNKTGDTLTGVTLIITDNITKQKDTVTIDESGGYRRPLTDKHLNDEANYSFEIQKEGYFTKNVTYKIVLDKPGQYNVHETIDFRLDPIVKDLSEMIQINPINFDLNKYNIRPDAAKELDKIVAIMNKYPNLVIELGAHTDCRGSKAYNQRLSDKRAKSSAQYIRERIVNPERIYGIGYGESRLLNDCHCEGRVKSNCTEEQHAMNRRTEFKVIKTGNENLKVKNNSPDSFDN